MAEARSPLAHLAASLAAVVDRTGGALRVAEIPFLAQIDIRLDPTGPAAALVGAALGAPLPLAAGTSTRSPDLEILWLGPDEWLVLGPPGCAGDLETRVRTAAGPEPVGVTDVSAQRTTLALTGPAAGEVLSTGCAIDLDPSAFPGRACVQTLLARTGVILVADEGPQPAYRLLVRSSFADYAATWLLDAATEHVVLGGYVTSG